MDRHTLLTLAQRILAAPDLDARARELTSLASARQLARIGLSQRPSVLGTVLATTGVLALGVVVGAAAGLLFAPTAGVELRKRMLARVEELSRDATKTRQRLTERVSGARVSVAPAPPAAVHPTDGHAAGARA